MALKIMLIAFLSCGVINSEPNGMAILDNRFVMFGIASAGSEVGGVHTRLKVKAEYQVTRMISIA